MITLIKRYLLSWQLTTVLVGLYAILLALATFLGNAFGLAMARGLVYNNPLCYLLLLFLVIQFMAMSLSQRLWSRKRIGSLVLHGAFVFILVGAWVTSTFGLEGVMHIREGEESNVLINQRGEEIGRIPFSIVLEDFRLTRYPGSNSPSSFESFVIIKDRDIQRKAHIYMNNVASEQGYRFYQSSFDTDEQGTFLSVNYDPWGMRITYTGYLMLLCGMLLIVLDRRSYFRLLLEKLRGVTWMLLVLIPFSLSAQDASEMRQHTVSDAQARLWSSVLVQSGEGRIEPFNTYASTILRKLCRDTKWNGLAPEQVVLGIVIDPQYWSQVMLLRQTDKTLAMRMGLSLDRFLRFTDLFDSKGDYMLNERVEQVYSRPVNRRSTEEKNLLKIDEKANIFYALMRGEFLALFPTGGEAWISAGEQTSSLQGKDSLMVTQFFPMYADAVLVNHDEAQATAVLDMLKTFQQRRAEVSLPSQQQVDCEIFYNKARIFFVSAIGYMLLGLLLLSLSISYIVSEKPWMRRVIYALIVGAFCLFAWHTFGLALRWYIAGRAPWSNAYETMTYVAWATALSGLLFIRRSVLTSSAAVLFAGLLLFVANLNFMDPAITPLVPVLKSYWLMIHVAVITASYGFFGMSFFLGLLSVTMLWAQQWSPRLGGQVARMRIINELSIYIGLFLLTAGIFLGAVWANVSWGRYWGWDPKETWALITMLVYVLVLHARYLPGRISDRTFSWLSVLAILSVGMTYFGVNYYLSGLHSYGA